MKAILVIDKPKDCFTCELGGSKVCIGGCPLKQIPKKKNEEIVIKGHTGEIAEAYQDGWNDCIKEITK